MLLFNLKKETYISEELFKEYSEKRTVDSYPSVFKDYPEFGITFRSKEPEIILLTDIIRDQFFQQLGRVGVNKKRDEIYNDIDNNLFTFTEIPPIALYIRQTGDYYLLDGVTRITKLDLEGTADCIFEVFESELTPTPENLEDIRVYFGLMFNLYKKPAGDAILDDIQRGILTLVRNRISVSGVQVSEDLIGQLATNRLDALDVSQKLTTNQYNLVIQFCKDEILKRDNVGCRHFPSGTNKDKILETLGLVDTDEDKYIVAAASTPSKIFGIVADLNLDSVDYENVERINLVFYIGTVSGATAKEQFNAWKEGLQTCIDKFMNTRKGFCTNTGRVVNGKRKEGLGVDIRFFGGVPQVWAYDEDIPMNKIVKFQGNKDINPNKHDIII
jgi:hypothetical protein